MESSLSTCFISARRYKSLSLHSTTFLLHHASIGKTVTTICSIHTMKLAVLLLTLYGMLAAACYFPFNNPSFANRTLLNEYLQELPPNAASGWTSTVIGQHAPCQPWPPHNPKVLPLVTIVYCFTNSLQRSNLVDLGKSNFTRSNPFYDRIAVWSSATNNYVT